MRVLLALTLLLACGEARAFDHFLHDGKLATAGKESLGCVACHGRSLRPGHETCFGKCHQAPNGFRRAAESQGVCATCHATNHPAKDFSLFFSHRAHSASCESCHAGAARDAPAAAAATPHARCAGCHLEGKKGGEGPRLACAACHRLTAGRDTTPQAERTPYAVTGIFRHATHLPRVAGTDRCVTCHAAAHDAEGERVPLPAAASCAPCHDGRRAFSTLEPSCRRCHARADARALPSAAPDAVFDHGTHQARGVALACASCHTLGPDGAPRPAAARHAPCSDSGCHQQDFNAREPRICGACHVGSEPWRELHADAPRRVRTEFGVEFSHGGHLEGSPPRVRTPCDGCHTGVAGGPDKRLGLGHASCSGAACHTPEKLAACEGCHKLGLLPARDRRRADDPWSVGDRFHHDKPHQGTDCTSCHPTAAAARTVDVIETPRKAVCAPCHDGQAAFKLTGHGCARCHGR